MKKIRIIAAVLALLTIFAVGVYASDLSPGMTVIRQRTVITKCGIAGDELTFKTSEFESVLGIKDLKYITITKLPDVEMGVLKLGGIDVIEGQSIPRGSIGFLKFVPKAVNNAYAATFSFTVDTKSWDGVALKCVMNLLPTVNFSPIADGGSFSTVQGVAAVANLAAYDPDGDVMSFELLTYPKNGSVKITDAGTGSFVYTPKSGYKGKDSFKYRVVDVYGNISKEAVAEIKVDTNEAKIVYADMQGHWAHSAAVKLAAKGIVSHEEIAGIYYFSPSKAMTKSDFTVLLLMAAGYGDDLKPVLNTGFSDDEQIEAAHKPYIAKAKELSIISGTEAEGGLINFEPDKELTRADAAVIISKLLNLESEASLAAFSDRDSIPAEAVKYVAALYKEGIMSGVDQHTMAPNSIFDRAQTVTVLERVIEYIDGNKKDEGILSWFGIK
ncbi:MAG: S-layer homology domain-containing protein [Eubacteriales bacterium]|nr:S-layer homology domain-containing protein [Eubacteriales bacterium]MDD4474641.1 S-layer homology domain-containing protein [Eubacteriales bacterium]